jgi:hypothetical protein
MYLDAIAWQDSTEGCGGLVVLAVAVSAGPLLLARGGIFYGTSEGGRQ